MHLVAVHVAATPESVAVCAHRWAQYCSKALVAVVLASLVDLAAGPAVCLSASPSYVQWCLIDRKASPDQRNVYLSSAQDPPRMLTLAEVSLKAFPWYYCLLEQQGHLRLVGKLHSWEADILDWRVVDRLDSLGAGKLDCLGVGRLAGYFRGATDLLYCQCPLRWILPLEHLDRGRQVVKHQGVDRVAGSLVEVCLDPQQHLSYL